MKLYIKYMLSTHCVIVVKSELRKLGIKSIYLNPGEFEVTEKLTLEQHSCLKKVLAKSGLELVDYSKTCLVGKIKEAASELVFHPGNNPHHGFSRFISHRLNHDYTYLANLFSEVTLSTIEQFIIYIKAEGVKELLLYDDLNLKQISYKLNYSSVAHLSAQFKKVTGMTPSEFRCVRPKRKYIIANAEELSVN